MKFLNYDGVATLWAKIKAFVIGATDTSKVIDGNFGNFVDIAETVTPLNRYRGANYTSYANSNFREYRFSAAGVKRLVLRLAIPKASYSNGFCFVVFSDGTNYSAPSDAIVAAGASLSSAMTYNTVVEVPEGTTNIYVSNRPSALSAPYIRAIYEEAQRGVTSDIYSMAKPYVADTKDGVYSTGASISKDRVITTQTSTASLYRYQIINIANLGITAGTKLIAHYIHNRVNPLESRIGFSATQPSVGDTLMEDGFYSFLGFNDPDYMDCKRILTVPEGANYMVVYAYYVSDAEPTYLQVAKYSDPIEERATVLESKTTYLYSGVLAQGKKLHFPVGAIGKATIWNGFPYDGECGTMREILIGYDPDGAALGGTAGVYRVIRDAAIDTTVDPDDAVTISIASDCVEIEAVDGTSYYSVLSTIEPTVI